MVTLETEIISYIFSREAATILFRVAETALFWGDLRYRSVGIGGEGGGWIGKVEKALDEAANSVGAELGEGGEEESVGQSEASDTEAGCHVTECWSPADIAEDEGGKEDSRGVWTA
jgi:hypothetical protein